MKIVVFGLSISSSWGNGHATLWRGLCKALAQDRHRVTFFERDAPYYAGARDLDEVPGGELVIYPDWESVRFRARRELRDADVAIVTSYCPDGIAAGDLVASSGRIARVFYDLDTPITLARLSMRETVPYIGAGGLKDYDLVLSFTGGGALDALRTQLGAVRVEPLYGHVDPDIHRPAQPQPHYRCDLSYLGTYSPDRQAALQSLFIDAALRRLDGRFLIGGAQYPDEFPWSSNIYFVQHLPPEEHPSFFSSSRLTLNVTRKQMADMGWCPSGRLFEAAACGVPILTDRWQGLDHFFTPGSEILVADRGEDTIAALDMDDAELARIARAGRERTLTEHTSSKRAAELVALLDSIHPRVCAPEATEA